jgi:hypothetical protein
VCDWYNWFKNGQESLEWQANNVNEWWECCQTSHYHIIPVCDDWTDNKQSSSWLTEDVLVPEYMLVYIHL